MFANENMCKYCSCLLQLSYIVTISSVTLLCTLSEDIASTVSLNQLEQLRTAGWPPGAREAERGRTKQTVLPENIPVCFSSDINKLTDAAQTRDTLCCDVQKLNSYYSVSIWKRICFRSVNPALLRINQSCLPVTQC